MQQENRNKILFFGTPAIAASVLQALIDNKKNLIGVVTKPDKPIGRKQEILFNPVKQLAIKNNIPVFQPNKLIEFTNEINLLKPDLILTCAYGKIIPSSILQVPQFHCINVHASLLPKYRGGAPIHYALLNGEKQTGISLMFMEPSLDTGDIIYQESIKISEDETYQTLYQKLSSLAYKVISEKIDNLFNPNLLAIKQDDSKVTYSYNITRNDELIN